MKQSSLVRNAGVVLGIPNEENVGKPVVSFHAQFAANSIISLQEQLNEIVSKYKEFSRIIGDVQLETELDIPGLSRQLCLGQSSMVDSDSAPQTPGPTGTAGVHAAYVTSPPPSATSLWREAASQWQHANSLMLHEWNETAKVTPSVRKAYETGSDSDHGVTFPLSSHCHESAGTSPATQGCPSHYGNVPKFPASVLCSSACGGDSVCNAWSPDPFDSFTASVEFAVRTSKLDAGLLVPEKAESGSPLCVRQRCGECM